MPQPLLALPKEEKKEKREEDVTSGTDASSGWGLFCEDAVGGGSGGERRASGAGCLNDDALGNPQPRPKEPLGTRSR